MSVLVNPLTQQEISDTELRGLTELVTMQMAAEAELAILEETEKRTKERLNKLQMELVPNKMQELGLTSISLSNGANVKVEDHFSAGIPTQESIRKDVTKAGRRVECFKWLKENDGVDIIKSEVVITLTKGQEKELQRIAKILEKNKVPFNLLDEVHWQTLRSFLKEQIQQGRDVPRDLFSVFEGK